MTDDKYDEIFDKHIEEFRDHSKKKKDLPNYLAKDLEDAGMPLPKISSEIKHRLREHYEECEISDKWVTENLFDRYKRPKKVPEQKTAEPSVIGSTKNEEKKPIEVLAGTNTQRTSEPTNDEDLEPPDSFYEPPENISTPKNLEPTPEPPEVWEKKIQERDQRIKNLEDQLKAVRERKPEPQRFPNIKLNQLQLDDGKTFDNTVYVSCIGLSSKQRKGGVARDLADDIDDFLEKFPELPFMLIQQDNTKTNVRVNFTKPQFITGNPH